MTASVRFAPSPTGRLHVGNVRTALVNWLYARTRGGTFILRMDDTDHDRSTVEYARGIEADLTWLGLTWDTFVRQSEREHLYAEAAERLKAAGLLYPCYETPEELELKRRLQLAQRKPPVYDRTALALSAAERARLEAEGRAPHWRFKLPTPGRLVWTDLVRGETGVELDSLSDPVLIRADGTYLYTLPSVVDDIALGVTHVLRGEDHVTNTAVQIALFAALDGMVPEFAHFSLLTGTEGEGLSKRAGTLSIAEMRESGIEPMAILSLLARLGTSDPVEPRTSLEDLLTGFDIDRFGRAAARFDPAELRALNARVLHEMPFSAVRERLAVFGLDGVTEDFWLAVRPNLATLSEVVDWWQVVQGPLTPEIEDPDFTATAAALLPGGDWDATTWGDWTKAVKASTGAKGKALFLPLRRALTGRDHGPDLGDLLPLIGPERAQARLLGKTA